MALAARSIKGEGLTMRGSGPKLRREEFKGGAMIVLFGRILIGVLFLLAGAQKIGGIEGFTHYMVAGGAPAFLAWPAILFEIAAGLMLMIGLFTRWTALALAGFCVLTAFGWHMAPDDPVQMALFLKNLAIAGGLLVLYVHGPGLLSLDARRGGID